MQSCQLVFEAIFFQKISKFYQKVAINFFHKDTVQLTIKNYKQNKYRIIVCRVSSCMQRSSIRYTNIIVNSYKCSITCFWPRKFKFMHIL